MSMNLIHLVPDTVMQWIGAQSQSASAGSQAGQDFTRSTAGAMAAGGQVAGSAQQKVNAYVDNKKQLNRPKRNQDGTYSTGAEDIAEALIGYDKQKSGGLGAIKSDT